MRIILYRYHENIEFCKDRLSFIRKNNPNTPIYGLYGGEEKNFEKFDSELKSFLAGNYCIRNKTGFWKWKNSDLAYRLWYQHYGKNIEFESLVVLEWDLIQFGGIDEIYQHVDSNQIGFTGLVSLPKIEKEWFWTRDPDQREYWLQLLDYAKSNFNYTDIPYGVLCPGVCLPKEFLEKYSQIDVPELCHDELRLPLFAQILGFELVDNGFYRKWFSKKEAKYFNCNEEEISEKRILRELKSKHGRRAFHPYRKLLSNSIFDA